MHFSPNTADLIYGLKDLGVFVAMFLESSILPLPSEVIVIGAGAIGISMASIVVFGALGSTLGAMVGYALGRYAAMPLVLKFGKFILLKPHHIYKAEQFAKKHGTVSVLIGRIIPIVPFKVFSIAAGITKIPFVPFVAFTLLGVIPRILILAIFGMSIVKYTKPVCLILASAVVIFIAVKLAAKLASKNNKHKS
ncbi:MAG: DedA family protein [Candidatus Omnitrophota bacterium]|jgi:membrane protein DedA with SNARE-associated domain